MKTQTLTDAKLNARHYGIDALRILSMFMVLILHVLGSGGILDAAGALSSQYIAAYLLETAAFCAVNCYALISGYVMINAKYRYTNLLMIWLQVTLYNIVYTVIFYFIPASSVGNSALIFSAFPVFRSSFWYFSAYTGLFFLIPICNCNINSLNRRQAKVLCGCILIVFSVLPIVFGIDVFSLSGGYSVIWLILMYILGACIRKFGFGTGIQSSYLLIGYFVSTVISVGFLVLAQLDCGSLLLLLWGEEQLIQYTSPTIVFNGIALLLLFSRIRIKSPRMIKLLQLLAPLAFGVYIAHLQPQMAIFLFGEHRFTAFLDYPIPLMIGAILLSAAVLFTFCAAIDKLRLWLFDALKLKKRLLALEEKYIGDLWSDKENKS